ncbi:TPA: hypothetical protein ACTW4K_005278 [Klebsiella quasipneumoniae subsp. similipneumoniae]
MSIPAPLLRDFNQSEDSLKKAIKVEAVLPSNTDGMTSDRQGNLYTTALTLNGLMKRDAHTGKKRPMSPTMLFPGRIHWPWVPEGIFIW